jgi:hypothetical protein
MLQEFWHKNEELCELYRSRLGAAGYTMFQMGRTNDKGDGLFTAISSNHLRVLDMREIVFHDCGDRVAQLFHLQVNQSCMQEVEERKGLLEELFSSHKPVPIKGMGLLRRHK